MSSEMAAEQDTSTSNLSQRPTKLKQPQQKTNKQVNKHNQLINLLSVETNVEPITHVE